MAPGLCDKCGELPVAFIIGDVTTGQQTFLCARCFPDPQQAPGRVPTDDRVCEEHPEQPAFAVITMEDGKLVLSYCQDCLCMWGLTTAAAGLPGGEFLDMVTAMIEQGVVVAPVPEEPPKRPRRRKAAPAPAPAPDDGQAQPEQTEATATN